jgi:hypothetical protein
MRQAIRDAGEGEAPVVLMRADGRGKGQEDDFLVMFRLKDAQEVALAITLLQFENHTDEDKGNAP